MNKFFAKRYAAMITLMLFGIVAVAVDADEKQQFEKPSFSQGDHWVYSTPKGKERHEYVGEKDGYHVFMINGAKQYLDADLNVKGGTRTDYKFPLYVGKYWSFESDVARGQDVSGSAGKEKVRVTCEVKGIEPIKTTAGIFQALNITCDQMFTHGGQARTRGTYSYWYAPEVKHFIKNSKDTVLEKYKINK